MNAKLILKTLFLIVLLFFLVLMGMANLQWIDFYLPPILPHKVTQRAAVMYYAFFAMGVLAGTIMTAGGRKGGAAKTNRVEK